MVPGQYVSSGYATGSNTTYNNCRPTDARYPMCWYEHVCMQTTAIWEIVNVLVNK